MPTNNLTDTGQVKTQEFASRFPGIATILSQQTTSEAGSSADVGTALLSDPGQEKINNLFSGDDAAFDNLLNFELPTTEGQTPEASATSLFGAAEENVRLGRAAKSVTFDRLNRASAELDKFTSFNKASYTKKRLKELDPASEIDEQINELRQQMFIEDIRLDNDPEMNLLSPAQRTELRTKTQRNFINEITALSQQRTTRMKSATDQIDDEISSNDDQINASAARINALNRTLNSIKEFGKDNEAIVSIRMDLSKEQERLKKIRKSASGASGSAYSTQKEMARIHLREQAVLSGRGINEAEIDALVEATFLQTVGKTSIIGKEGEENQSVDISKIRFPEKTDAEKLADYFDGL